MTDASEYTTSSARGIVVLRERGIVLAD